MNKDKQEKDNHYEILCDNIHRALVAIKPKSESGVRYVKSMSIENFDVYWDDNAILINVIENDKKHKFSLMLSELQTAMSKNN